MRENLIYRESANLEVEQIIKLRYLSFGAYKDQISLESWGILEKRLLDKDTLSVRKDNSIAFACFDKDELVGMAFLTLSGNPTDFFEADWSFVRMVAVHPKYQGKGIARNLMNMCLNFAKEKGEKIMALHTSELMHSARHIYESLGFVRLREIEPRFGMRYWLYTLTL